MKKCYFHIQQFTHILESLNLIKSMERIDSFYDEPKFFQYSTFIRLTKRVTDGVLPTNSIPGTGISFISRYEALIKSLGETIERLCLYSFNKKNIKFGMFSSLRDLAINPASYNQDSLLNRSIIGWVKGYNITQDSPYLLPAQLVYLTFRHTYKEQYISANISTGAAGGFDHESTLLRGIYEVIERDTYMTNYLNKIQSPKIPLQKLRIPIIQEILEILKRYRLETHTFDITNDLEIPTFLTILVDKTKRGPTLSFGTKTSLDVKDAVLGSIEEAVVYRRWIKYEMYNRQSTITINPSQIKSLAERGLYWIPFEMINKFKYLISQKPIAKIIRRNSINVKEQLKEIKQILAKKGFNIFYTDITMPYFKKTHYIVYKVLIPGLQPLYLDERKKEINLKRIKAVARYFGKRKLTINTIPHPFI